MYSGTFCFINPVWETPYARSPSGIWFDGFEDFLGDWKLPDFSAIQFQNVIFCRNSLIIDGFENTSLKIDGFSQTHADEAPDYA